MVQAHSMLTTELLSWLTLHHIGRYSRGAIAANYQRSADWRSQVLAIAPEIERAREAQKYVIYSELSNHERSTLFPALDLVNRNRWDTGLVLWIEDMFQEDEVMDYIEVVAGRFYPPYLLTPELRALAGESFSPRRLVGPRWMDVWLSTVIATFVAENKPADLMDFLSAFSHSSSDLTRFIWFAFAFITEVYYDPGREGHFPEPFLAPIRVLRIALGWRRVGLTELAACARYKGLGNSEAYIRRLMEVVPNSHTLLLLCREEFRISSSIVLTQHSPLAILVDSDFAESLTKTTLVYTSTS
ncbi:hypothetical protein H4R33_000355 [Dimargaris cristalligena]|uniref:Uncharacterized protein n=1 Tax=Dimargaris cristalligena TaxID=215637 RepID=A0A4P9ZLT4_9FUNG|nr:hypothetical protein H4R33_000355 [Dimargaris cristalligena]RKP34095.1 hypothetical protein BJ085DRAFT_29956 [Dimargaris cristalligena]|eukprot:RKP34095.1 hypothetical protein BJ085DRAFT_29956 [Dimargaris cristalligena]